MIYKPKSCKECLVYRENVKKCWCGVNRNEIDKGNTKELTKQWTDCVLEWDKEEGK